jgi:type II secretory pathway pseudopilin PulG
MRARSWSGGFTVLELITAAAVAALLLSIAVPTYFKRVQRLKINRATADLVMIAGAIEPYRTIHDFKPPLALTDLSGPPATDPWGRAYAYLNFAAPIAGITGKITLRERIAWSVSGISICAHAMAAATGSSAPDNRRPQARPSFMPSRRRC